MAPKRKFSLADLESALPVFSSPSSSNAFSEGKEVTLLTESLKTFNIKIKRSETIQNIKAFRKQEEDNVSSNSRELVISKNQLNYENEVIDNITADIATINLASREKRIKWNVPSTSTDVCITTGVQVKSSDTVGKLKSMINIMEGTRSDEYQLVFNGNQLRSDVAIDGSGIENDSILYMVLDPVDTFPLQISMPSGRVDQITVKRQHKIYYLKVALHKEIQMPINQWHLAYSGNTLEDFKTVTECGLQADSLLEVMFPSVQIFVRIKSGMQITVFIKLTDDVISLKEKIFEKAGYPVKYQILNFSGKLLKEGQRLFTYGIKRSSTVHLR